MRETLKKVGPESGASSAAGSYVMVSSEDDPMKQKSPRTKRSAAAGGSRAPTPESKRKHEGPLRERLERKDKESLGEDDLKVLLDSLKELEKVQSHDCLLYTSPSPRDRQKSRMPSSA